jgi:hypothetical protein
LESNRGDTLLESQPTIQLSFVHTIHREFDYPTIKGIVIQSLEKIVKEAALRNTANIRHDTIFEDNDYPNNVNLLAPPASPLLKLKIRNTTQYLNWRLSILKRDNFICKICHTSVKENKSLGLEVHNAKSFNDICKENNVSTVEQALGCKELWSANNGISVCYVCHKDIERLRAKLRNMFRLVFRYFPWIGPDSNNQSLFYICITSMYRHLVLLLAAATFRTGLPLVLAAAPTWNEFTICCTIGRF